MGYLVPQVKTSLLVFGVMRKARFSGRLSTEVDWDIHFWPAPRLTRACPARGRTFVPNPDLIEEYHHALIAPSIRAPDHDRHVV
jgi:hypothetical protein